MSSHLPTVVHQHWDGAEAEDPQSTQQLPPALHLEGTGILEGQSGREQVGLPGSRRPGGRGALHPQGQEVRE